MPKTASVRVTPWASLLVRLSSAEVQAIAARGVVPGRLASRILEVVARDCDELVRFEHGAMLTRRETRRLRTHDRTTSHGARPPLPISD